MVDEAIFAATPVVYEAGGKAKLEFTLSCEGLPASAKPVVGLFGEDGALVGRTEVSGSSSFAKSFIVNANPKSAPAIKFSVYDSASGITVDSFLGSTSAPFKSLLDNLESKLALCGNDKQPTGASLVVTKKAKAKKEKKPQQKKQEKKPKADKVEAVDPVKAKKAALKEGGKKAQDICGLSDMGGVKFFHVSVDSPAGDMALLENVLEGFNKKVDPEAEDRKGGAHDLAKIIFSYNNEKLIWICNVPASLTDTVSIEEWNSKVIGAVGGKILEQTAEVIKGEVLADPDAGKFAIKMRDNAINTCYAWLTSKRLVLADDSDSDDVAYGDDDFPEYYDEAPVAAAAPAAAGPVFTDVDVGKSGADEYKSFDDDKVLGKPCPDLSTIEYLNSSTYAAPTKGQVLICVLWGQYHKPGYKFLPMYTELQKKYGSKVSVVGLSVDPDTSYATKFLEDPGKKYSTVFTTEFAVAWDKDGLVKKAFMEAAEARTFSPPHAYIISGDKIVWHQDHSELGATAPSYLGLMEAQVDAVLAGSALTSTGTRPVIEEDDEEEEGDEMNIEMDDDDDVLGFL